MAVPQALCHPFATAKIVEWPATCSVRDGLIVAARSGDAALCACGGRDERTGNRCDRDKGSKCFPHSGPSWRAPTRPRRTINDAKKFPPLQVTPSGPLYQVNLVH